MRARAASAAELAAAARDDVGVFAEVLLGEPLWGHQLDLARSGARVRSVLAGRQVGKSRTLAVLALHEAFRAEGRRVLIVSAGDDAAKSLLEEISMLAEGRLAASVDEDQATKLTTSTGSEIRAVPASQKRVRGKSVDLLIMDEAAFIDEEIWRAARYTIIARPGSQVVLSSTPWGRRDRFFAVAHRAGLESPGAPRVEGYESFTWPSTVSPLVDAELLEMWRRTSTEREYRTEVLAEWVDESGAYFTSSELDAAVADYELIDPAGAEGQLVVGGVDWGLSVDANTLALIGVLFDHEMNAGVSPDEPVFFVPWLEEHFKMPYSDFVARVVDVADRDAGGFWVRSLASETNGVGAAPTEMLARRMRERRTGCWVEPVHTDLRRKESAYGALKLLLQQHRLVLPRSQTSLLRQMQALEFETTEQGNVRIAVPERQGHDDLAMALAQAASCLRVSIGYRPDLGRWGEPVRVGDGDVLTTGGGVRIHERPRCWDVRWAFSPPKGAESGDGY